LGSRNRCERRRRHGRDGSRSIDELGQPHDHLGSGKDKGATKQRDRKDRHEQCAGRAHGAAQHLGSEVRKPRALPLSAFAIVQRGQQDALVQVDRRSRDRERTKQPEDASAAADLRRACGTNLDVSGQACSVGRPELVEQERIDQRASACAIQSGATVRVRHITYMTRQGQKVAAALRAARRLPDSAPERLLRTDPELARTMTVRRDEDGLHLYLSRRCHVGFEPLDQRLAQQPRSAQ
jgi:hypothetical protein